MHDGRDNGVTDTWTPALTGSQDRPHESRDPAWVVVPDHLTAGRDRRDTPPSWHANGALTDAKAMHPAWWGLRGAHEAA